jgi:hypothetical protein
MRLLIELKDFLALNSYIDSLIVAPGGFGQAVGADCQMEWDWAAGAIKLGVDPDKIEELKRLSGVAQK